MTALSTCLKDFLATGNWKESEGVVGGDLVVIMVRLELRGGRLRVRVMRIKGFEKGTWWDILTVSRIIL